MIVEITQTNSNEKIEEEKQTKASETISTFFGARYFGTFLTVFSGGVLLENLTKQTGIFFLSLYFFIFF